MHKIVWMLFKQAAPEYEYYYKKDVQKTTMNILREYYNYLSKSWMIINSKHFPFVE